MSDLADLIADEAEALYIVTSTLAERAGLKSYVFAERVSANLEQWAPQYEAHIGVPVSCEGWAALLALVELDRLQAQAEVNRMLSGEFTAEQGRTAMPPAPPFPLAAEDMDRASGASSAASFVPAAPRSLNSPRVKEKGATGRWFGVAVAAGCAFWCGVLWFVRNWR